MSIRGDRVPQARVKGLRRALVLALTLLVLAPLTACSVFGGDGVRATGRADPSTSSAPDAKDGDRPGPKVRLPRLAQGDPSTAGLDFPKLPKRCFAPGQQTPRAQACALTPIRKKRPTLVIWGDSHAWQYLPAVRAAVRGRPVNLISFVAGGCPPVRVPASFDGRSKCVSNDRAALRFIEFLADSSVDYEVLLGSFWGGFRRAYRQLHGSGDGDGAEVPSYNQFTVDSIDLAHDGTPPLFAELARLGSRVTIIGESPTVPDDAPSCPAGQEPYRCPLPREVAIPDEAATQAWLEDLAAPLAGRPRFVDPTTKYCTATTCLPEVDGQRTFYDALHLGAGLTGTMKSYFTPVVDRLLASS